MLDIRRKVIENQELYDIVDEYIPKMLHPKNLPGFGGFQLVSGSYLVNDLTDPKNIPYTITISPISCIFDMGSIAKKVGIGLFEEDGAGYIIFLRNNLPWGCTFFTFVTDIYRIMLIDQNGTEYANSIDCLREAAKLTKELCKMIFPGKVQEILEVTNNIYNDFL